jgi:CRP-like cAMP-binding protein
MMIEFFKSIMGAGFNSESVSLKSTIQKFPKGAVMVQAGNVETKFYFLLKGIVEVTIPGEKEWIYDFFFPNSVLGGYSSLLTGKPSKITIAAIEDCEVEVYEWAELKKQYETSIGANQMGRFLTEQIFLLRSKREIDFLSKSAEKRYGELLQSQPDLILKIPVHRIARYLGIHPESLSRIRKKLNS